MSTMLSKSPPKREDDNNEGREVHESRANIAANRFHNNLELRLGISMDSDLVAGKVKSGGAGGAPFPEPMIIQDVHLLPRNGGAKRIFCEVSGNFVHPWSLAARQEKTALEQAHQKPTSIVSRTTNSSVPVGWPPLCSFRKNLPGKTKTVEENKPNNFQERATMFVKVNMEGCAVGRKIDLKAHDSYDSLSHALQKMFHTFLSANHLINQMQEESNEAKFPNYILLYEDTEGDRMLVGDVPWEMFISSAKRLYITQEH